MIISVSGKINSGKDTVGEIVQIISASPHFTDEAIVRFLGRPQLHPLWENKKFADKLKDMACMLLGCTREQLEDREFKEKELGEEWDKWYVEKYGLIKAFNPHDWEIQNKHKPFGTELECKLWWEKLRNSGSHALGNPYIGEVRFVKHSMTPRLLLQLLGTECGRQIIHPNIWVNALMSEYKNLNPNFSLEDGDALPVVLREKYPNWIVTDTRFPNELVAVKSRKGITIRVNRNLYELLEDGRHTWFDKKDRSGRFYIYHSGYTKEMSFSSYLKEINEGTHESETALDNAEFDYVIENDGELVDLVSKVREIMLKENLWQEKQ